VVLNQIFILGRPERFPPQAMDKTYIEWVNDTLKDRHICVTSLSNDFKDGIVLLNLIEVIGGCSIQSLGIANGKYYIYMNDKPPNKEQQTKNVQLALQCFDHFGIRRVGCEMNDIIEGNAQMIKALLFSLKKYQKDQLILKRHLTAVDTELEISRKGSKNKAKTTSVAFVTTNTTQQNKVPISSVQKKLLPEHKIKRRRNARGDPTTRGRNGQLQYDPRASDDSVGRHQQQQENEWEETLKSTSQRLWELNKLIHRARNLERVLEHSQNSESTDISSDYTFEARELAGLSEKSQHDYVYEKFSTKLTESTRDKLLLKIKYFRTPLNHPKNAKLDELRAKYRFKYNLKLKTKKNEHYFKSVSAYPLVIEKDKKPKLRSSVVSDETNASINNNVESAVNDKMSPKTDSHDRPSQKQQQIDPKQSNNEENESSREQSNSKFSSPRALNPPEAKILKETFSLKEISQRFSRNSASLSDCLSSSSSSVSESILFDERTYINRPSKSPENNVNNSNIIRHESNVSQHCDSTPSMLPNTEINFSSQIDNDGASTDSKISETLSISERHLIRPLKNFNTPSPHDGSKDIPNQPPLSPSPLSSRTTETSSPGTKRTILQKPPPVIVVAPKVTRDAKKSNPLGKVPIEGPHKPEVISTLEPKPSTSRLRTSSEVLPFQVARNPREVVAKDRDAAKAKNSQSGPQWQSSNIFPVPRHSPIQKSPPDHTESTPQKNFSASSTNENSNQIREHVTNEALSNEKNALRILTTSGSAKPQVSLPTSKTEPNTMNNNNNDDNNNSSNNSNSSKLPREAILFQSSVDVSSSSTKEVVSPPSKFVSSVTTSVPSAISSLEKLKPMQRPTSDGQLAKPLKPETKEPQKRHPKYPMFKAVSTSNIDKSRVPLLLRRPKKSSALKMTNKRKVMNNKALGNQQSNPNNDEVITKENLQTKSNNIKSAPQQFDTEQRKLNSRSNRQGTTLQTPLSKKVEPRQMKNEKYHPTNSSEKRRQFTPSKSDAHMAKSKTQSATTEESPAASSKKTHPEDGSLPKQVNILTKTKIADKTDNKPNKLAKWKSKSKMESESKTINDTKNDENNSDNATANLSSESINQEINDDNEVHKKRSKFKQFLSTFKIKLQLSFGRQQKTVVSETRCGYTKGNDLTPSLTNTDTENTAASASSIPQSPTSRRRPSKKRVPHYKPSELDATV